MVTYRTNDNLIDISDSDKSPSRIRGLELTPVEDSEAVSKWYVDQAGGAVNLGDLNDVDLTTTPPSNGDGLVYDGGSMTWVPGPGGGVSTVEDSGVPVATATTTMNFGNNLIVTNNGGGKVTVDALGGGGGSLITQPLKGHTFTPFPDRVELFSNSVTSTAPAGTPETVDSGSIDITDGGTYFTPANTGFIQIRVQLNALALGNNSIQLYVEDTLSNALASVNVKLNLELAEQTGTAWGMVGQTVWVDDEYATFLVPFDSVNDEFSYRIDDLRDDLSSTGDDTIDVKFFIEGYWILESVFTGPPMEGYSFHPSMYSPRIVRYDETDTGAQIVDLTAGGALTVPANAEYVLIRGFYNLDADMNSSHYAYSANIAANLPSSGTITDAKLILDAIESTTGAWEATQSATWVEQIDLTVNPDTIAVSMDFDVTGSGATISAAVLDLWVEGFYVKETLAVMGTGNGEDLIGSTDSTTIVDGIEVSASAVNYVAITNAETGNNPIIEVDGTDTDIDLEVRSKGSGAVLVGAEGSGSSVIEADGPDTNIDLELRSKGSGAVLVGSDGASSSTIGAEGTNTDIDLVLKPKGSGQVVLETDIVSSVSSVQAEGSLTNIDLSLSGKGTGTVNIDRPVIPSGSTGSRPAGVVGEMYLDTDLNGGNGMLIIYNGSNWVNPSTGATV